jgi:low temperature requirement protein LtrA
MLCLPAARWAWLYSQTMAPAVVKEGSLLVEGDALQLSAAYAAAYCICRLAQLLLIVLLCTVPQEVRTKARVLVVVYVASSALWVASIWLCVPMKIVMWVISAWVEQSGPRYLQQAKS